MAEEIKTNETTDNPGAVAPESSNDTPTSFTPETISAEEHHSHLGPILAVLIVVLVLILGGLYLWGSALVRDAEINETNARNIPNQEPETPRAEADTQILNTVSSSNELGAIEADLESTQLDEMDAELSEIDRELDAALGQ